MKLLGPATDKQKGLLRKLNIKFKPDISKRDASDLISKALDDRKPTPRLHPLDECPNGMFGNEEERNAEEDFRLYDGEY